MVKETVDLNSDFNAQTPSSKTQTMNIQYDLRNLNNTMVFEMIEFRIKSNDEAGAAEIMSRRRDAQKAAYALTARELERLDVKLTRDEAQKILGNYYESMLLNPELLEVTLASMARG